MIHRERHGCTVRHHVRPRDKLSYCARVFTAERKLHCETHSALRTNSHKLWPTTRATHGHVSQLRVSGFSTSSWTVRWSCWSRCWIMKRTHGPISSPQGCVVTQCNLHNMNTQSSTSWESQAGTQPQFDQANTGQQHHSCEATSAPHSTSLSPCLLASQSVVLVMRSLIHGVDSTPTDVDVVWHFENDPAATSPQLTGHERAIPYVTVSLLAWFAKRRSGYAQPSGVDSTSTVDDPQMSGLRTPCTRPL